MKSHLGKDGLLRQNILSSQDSTGLIKTSGNDGKIPLFLDQFLVSLHLMLLVLLFRLNSYLTHNIINNMCWTDSIP